MEIKSTRLTPKDIEYIQRQARGNARRRQLCLPMQTLEYTKEFYAENPARGTEVETIYYAAFQEALRNPVSALGRWSIFSLGDFERYRKLALEYPNPKLAASTPTETSPEPVAPAASATPVKNNQPIPAETKPSSRPRKLTSLILKFPNSTGIALSMIGLSSMTAFLAILSLGITAAVTSPLIMIPVTLFFVDGASTLIRNALVKAKHAQYERALEDRFNNL